MWPGILAGGFSECGAADKRRSQRDFNEISTRRIFAQKCLRASIRLRATIHQQPDRSGP
jgi:hypothetical protein